MGFLKGWAFAFSMMDASLASFCCLADIMGSSSWTDCKVEALESFENAEFDLFIVS